MNYKLAMAIIAELQALFLLLESQDARWEALQDWTEKYPRWRKLINHYVKISPDEALLDLKAYLRQETGIPEVLMDQYITADVTAKARASIIRLQDLYKERQAQDKKPKRKKRTA